MHIQHQAQALHIVGIELRTSNDQAMATIPPFWQRFEREQVLARLPQRLSDEVYAVYTHFEHAGVDNGGLYSLVIGAAMPPQAEPPAGMVRAVAPAGPRAVFGVEGNRADKVGDAWGAVWRRDDLAKTYVADYERYAADGSIEIRVGLHRAPGG